MNYSKIYESLIERARTRSITGYIEYHHVIPKCLGGSNDSSNLVALTAEEHFLAHQLLIKIHHDSPMLYKLTYACQAMTLFNESHHGRQISKLKQYGWIRRAVSNATTGIKRGPHSQETRDKISLAKLGQPSALKGRTLPERTDEHRKNLSAASTGKKKSATALASIQKAAAARKGMVRSEQTRQKMSISRKGKAQPNIAKSRLGKPSGMLGKTQSAETRAKISETKKMKAQLKQQNDKI